MLLVKTLRKNKIAILMILVTVAVMIAPASAYFAGDFERNGSNAQKYG